MFQSSGLSAPHIPWNKGKLIGQRPPLKKPEIWSIRVRLELALFNLAIDSKLRGCDLVSCAFVTFQLEAPSPTARWLCNKKHINLFNLKSQNKRGIQ
jgi:hypothetical protein